MTNHLITGAGFYYSVHTHTHTLYTLYTLYTDCEKEKMYERQKCREQDREEATVKREERAEE